MESMRQFSFILIVLSALAASIAILRRRGAGIRAPLFTKRVRRLEVLERLALSQSSSLLLVRLDGREMLVASSNSGCSILEERQIGKGASA